MAVTPRGRFNPSNAFPEGGVVTPDVFPAPLQGRHGRLDLHDIVDGRIPSVRRGQTVREGWLSIALGNGPDADYTSPNLSEGEIKARRGRSRKVAEINVDVEATEIIKRVATTLVPAALEVPTFNGMAFSFAEDGPDLVTVEPVEQAIAFSGVASIKGVETVVRGIHFASTQENGWLHIGDPVEPLDPVA